MPAAKKPSSSRATPRSGRTKSRSPSARRGSSSKARSSLHRYFAKRQLDESGEPAGKSGARSPPRAGVWRFVIQKHAARRLHYDLRLEMAGVFKSWAVPKGLPTATGDKTLAVEVEDHPLDYGGFEGVIPPGNYGAGTVMIWDTGHYTVSGGDPERALRHGKVHFALLGKKCTGEWTLVRLRDGERDRGKTNWLLIKNRETTKRAPIKRAGRDRSVESGRTMEEISRSSRQWISRRAANANGRSPVHA